MSVIEEAALTQRVREQLLAAGSATVANVLVRQGLRNTMLAGIRPLRDDQAPTVGAAFTLRFIPAREDLDDLADYRSDQHLHRRAIEECPPGAVLVIDAQGCTRAASMGDLMATRLAARGVAGVVTDGGFRDAAGILGSGLSCYQREPAPPATPIALHPVALQDPIGCAGVAVYPGDIVLGDADGVVVIPVDRVEQVAELAAATAAYEEFAAQQVRGGRSIFGLFPATDESTREYEQWLADGRPGLHQN